MKDNLAEQYLVPLKRGLELLEFRTQVEFADHWNRPHKDSQHHAELLLTDHPGAFRKTAKWATDLLETASWQFCRVNGLVDQGSSAPAFAMFAGVRTMLNSAAILCWLTQPSIDSEERVRRSIIVRISESVGGIEFLEALGSYRPNIDDRVMLLNELASLSLHFGLQIQRRQDGQVVNTTPGKPPAREIAERCLKMGSEYDQCSMLADQMLGQFRDQQFRKSNRLNTAASATGRDTPISPEQLIFLGQTNAIAFTRAFWSFGHYFGWECDLNVNWLEDIFDKMHISDDHRFWRTS